MTSRALLTAIVALTATLPVPARAVEVTVPMELRGASTFYVTGAIPGTAPTAFMVDTGSSYMTINEETLQQLRAGGGVEFRREIVGILASGEERRVPIYRIPQMRLGGGCLLDDVEVAVFPGRTRQILGLNVLRRTAPFRFSVDPPVLTLSNCGQAPQQVAGSR